MPQDFEKSKPRRNNEQENINRDTADRGSESRDRSFSDNTDVLARRDGTQIHDYKGEAQNVNDDTGRPLNEEELEHARNKANEGSRQRDAGS